MVTLTPNFHARPILYDIKQSPDDFETFTTVNTYAAPIYTWITTFMGLKIIKITNSNANDADVIIYGSYDGVNYDTIVQPELQLAASGTMVTRVVDFYAALRIYAKSHDAGKAAVISVQCVATSHEGTGAGKTAQGFETLTVTSGAVVPLTQATYGASTQAVITVEGNPVRVRWDGTDPTTLVGHLLQAGDSLNLDSNDDIVDFRAIATGGDATLTVTYSG